MTFKKAKKNTMQEFYKMKLFPNEGGLCVHTEVYLSVHETPCFHFCIPEWRKNYISTRLLSEGVSAYEQLKKRSTKFKRIAKINSRFAFDTKEKAYDQLVFMKKRQLVHLNRDIELLGAFMSFNKKGGYNDLESDHGQAFVPGTNDLVHEHYAFD